MKKNTIDVIDLHSDLLSYLSHAHKRTPHDPVSRTSIDQLKEGNVKVQTLAIYGSHPSRALHEGKEQIAQFRRLIAEYSEIFSPCRSPLQGGTPAVQLLASIENASVFASEIESLAAAFDRLESYCDAVGHLFYISLTWNNANRFGGGNAAPEHGLKEDGKHLLEWMNGRKIAIDLSHSSDKLAYGILDFIDQRSLNIPVIASHSNFRAITEVPRNLPEDLALEIIRRKGLIGLNLCTPFSHPTDPTALLRHVEYALSLGASDSLCFGADFFCDADFPDLKQKYAHIPSFYFPDYSNSSCYPYLLEQLVQHLGLSEEQMLKISSGNAARFLQTCIL